jgi:hypothetical protein
MEMKLDKAGAKDKYKVHASARISSIRCNKPIHDVTKRK